MFSGSKKFLAGKMLISSVLSCSMLMSSVLLAAPRDVTGSSSSKAYASESTRRRMVGKNAAARATRLMNARTVQNISIAKTNANVTAIIELDGEPRFNHFTLPSPYRLVVDVQNVANAAPSLIEVGDKKLKRIRVGKFDDVVRVVFDADNQQPFEIIGEGSQIKIAFGAPNNAGMATPALAVNNNNSAPIVTAPTTPQPTPSKEIKPVANSAVSVPMTNAVAAGTEPIVLPTVNTPKAKIGTRPLRRANARAFRTPIIALNNSVDAIPVPVARAKKGKANLPAVAPAPMAAVNDQNKVVKATPVKLEPAPAKAEPTVTPTAAPKETVSSVSRTAANNDVVKPIKPVPAPETKNDVVKAPVTPMPTPRPRDVQNSMPKTFNAADYSRADWVGDPINLDLRSTAAKTVDIRDFLRFISDTYKVNFVIDQSVRETPITVTLQNVPWNQAMDALLRANRLGVKVEGNILRVLSLDAITQEDKIRQEQIEARQKATPLVTEMVRLRYARALTGGGGGGGGSASSSASPSSSASSSASSAGASASGAGSTGGGSGLDVIIRSRLSMRGTLMADQRTNTLIITDLPENIEAAKDIIAVLDVPEPQVEIESRIVIANRNFARDLGVQLGALAVNTGSGGTAQVGSGPGLTSTATATGAQTSGGGIFPALADTMKAAGAVFGLGLTTGRIGSSQISAILTAAESKGNVKTISTPRITAQNNQTANIVNGVQIPVQTESNNTLTVSFVTAALRLEITPQISDSGYVNLRVVAENNSVNTAIATNAAPGINTQKAETTVLVPDGGTTIIGGINIDVERNTQTRTPGISSIPGLGELFKRRNVSRQTDEILFFITPRIYRPLDVAPVTVTQSPK